MRKVNHWLLVSFGQLPCPWRRCPQERTYVTSLPGSLNLSFGTLSSGVFLTSCSVSRCWWYRLTWQRRCHRCSKILLHAEELPYMPLPPVRNACLVRSKLRRVASLTCGATDISNLSIILKIIRFSGEMKCLSFKIITLVFCSSISVSELRSSQAHHMSFLPLAMVPLNYHLVCESSWWTLTSKYCSTIDIYKTIGDISKQPIQKN